MAKNKKQQYKIKHRLHGTFLSFIALVGIATSAYHLPAVAAGATSGVQTITGGACENPDSPYGEAIKIGIATTEINNAEGGSTITFKAYPASGLPPRSVSLAYIDILPNERTDVGNGPGVPKRLSTGYADSTWFINGKTASSFPATTATSTGDPFIQFGYDCGEPANLPAGMLNLYIDASGVHGGDSTATTAPTGNTGSGQQQTATPGQSAPKKATPKTNPLPPPPANNGAPIDVNKLDKYTTDGAVAWMKQEQVGNFTVGTEPHTITVKLVGSDYVTFVLTSTPQEGRLAIDETKQYDVTGDKRNDIEITLMQISEAQAGLALRQVTKAEQDAAAKPIEQTGSTSAPAASPPSQNQTNWLWVAVPATIAALAIIALFAISNVRTHFTMPLLRKLHPNKKL